MNIAYLTALYIDQSNTVLVFFTGLALDRSMLLLIGSSGSLQTLYLM